MKCESVEKGFLQYYGSPGQVCTDEAVIELEIEGIKNGKKIKSHLCETCAMRILNIVTGNGMGLKDNACN